jgi:hypothetical protein
MGEAGRDRMLAVYIWGKDKDGEKAKTVKREKTKTGKKQRRGKTKDGEEVKG